MPMQTGEDAPGIQGLTRVLGQPRAGWDTIRLRTPLAPPSHRSLRRRKQHDSLASRVLTTHRLLHPFPAASPALCKSIRPLVRLHIMRRPTRPR